MTLQKAAEKILKECMDLKQNESLLIITDSKLKNIAQVFLEEGKKITDKVKLAEIPVAENHGQEPQEKVAEEMKKCNVGLLITTKSLSHTNARREASKQGARLAGMSNVNEEMLIRFSKSNIKEDYEFGEKLKKIFVDANKVHLVTDKGTDLHFSVKGEKSYNDHDLSVLKTVYGNIPSGEVCIKPKERTANGKFVVDLSILNGLVDEPIEVIVKDNYAVNVGGGKSAELLKKTLDKFGKKARNIAEFGIGTNRTAKITGTTIEDEKVFGTVHIGFGNDISFGGKSDVPIHFDGIIDKPTFYVDDKKIMEKGRFLVK